MQKARTTKTAETTLQLEGDLPPGWRIVRPIELSVAKDEDGAFLLSDEIFGRYGAGDTVEEAREAYSANLVGYFEIMQDADKNNARNREMLELLQKYLAKLDA